MDEITKTEAPNEEEKELYQEEDALSLSDFPLQNSEPADDKRHSHKTQDKRRSSSEPSEFFEFFTSTADNMSHADDIIFRGKLVPFRNHHPFLKSLSADDATRFSIRTTVRSNSLSSRYSSTSMPRAKTPTTKRSTWYNASGTPKTYKRHTHKPMVEDITKKLEKRTKLAQHSTRNSIELLVESDEKTLCCSRRRDRTRSSRSEGSQAWKPNKWFVLMFGPLKLHPEMDLREMKSRVGRRPAGGDIRAAGRRSLWGFDWLRVLSCKSRASVAVTSVGLAPRY